MVGSKAVEERRIELFWVGRSFALCSYENKNFPMFFRRTMLGKHVNEPRIIIRHSEPTAPSTVRSKKKVTVPTRGFYLLSTAAEALPPRLFCQFRMYVEDITFYCKETSPKLILICIRVYDQLIQTDDDQPLWKLCIFQPTHHPQLTTCSMSSPTKCF